MKVKELLSDPTKWCQGDLAQNKNNKRTEPDTNKALKWSLLGAIYKCYGNGSRCRSLMTKVEHHLQLEDFKGIQRWNDVKDRRFEEVMALVNNLDL